MNQTLRQKMLRDLLSTGVLIGKRRDEVIQILGQPDGEYRRGDFPDWDLPYYLGPNGIDDYFLLLKLGKGDNVTEVSTATINQPRSIVSRSVEDWPHETIGLGIGF